MGQVPNTDTFSQQDVVDAFLAGPTEVTEINVANFEGGGPQAQCFTSGTFDSAIYIVGNFYYVDFGSAVADFGYVNGTYEMLQYGGNAIILDFAAPADTGILTTPGATYASVGPNDLVGLFAASNPDGFDPTYVGDKTNLLNFRNYNNEPIPPFPSGIVNAFTFDEGLGSGLTTTDQIGGVIATTQIDDANAWADGKNGACIRNEIAINRYWSAAGWDLSALSPSVISFSFWCKKIQGGTTTDNIFNGCPGAPVGSQYAGINFQHNEPNGFFYVMYGENNACQVSSTNRITFSYTDPWNFVGTSDFVMITIVAGATNGNTSPPSVYYNGVLQTLQATSGTGSLVWPTTGIEPRWLNVIETASGCQSEYKAMTGKFMVDEFYVWNKVLLESEILDLYNNGDGIFYS